MSARLLIALIFSLFSHNVFASEFETYRPEDNLVTKPAKPILDTKWKRKFRTVLRSEASKGVNFSGHYHLAYWGCGTNCIFWAVIDLASGKVWMTPQYVESCWPRNATEAPAKNIPEWFEYYSTSSLIYAYECNDDTGKSTFNLRKVYQWKKNAPVLLRTENVEF